MSELSSQPITVQSMYNWYNEGKLLVNRRYQRKLVWTLEEKKKLIDSILNKYPIPAILLAEKDGASGVYEIIDGLQRLHAIISFVEGLYPDILGRYFDINEFPTVKSRLENNKEEIKSSNEGNKPLIGKREVSNILDYALSLSIMRNVSEAEINDVFDRINTYGHRLSDQERRQAGVDGAFSKLVRNISCSLREDSSHEILPLEKMPSISIDLPSMKHGYDIQAEEVFWVKHGILRSTDLRDSLDEQCIADIAACIVGGTLIDRSKDALDKIYDKKNDEFSRINIALNSYGEERFSDEFKYCIDEIVKMCELTGVPKLRNLVFSKINNNPFQSIFSLIVISIHDLIFKQHKKISSYDRLNSGLKNISDKIDRDRGAVLKNKRMDHIRMIKGILDDAFIENDEPNPVYGSHSSMDVEMVIRRSEAELASYELKQGVLRLNEERDVDDNIFSKIIKTICAMANNGRSNGIAGKILIGVADNVKDAERIETLDGVNGIKVVNRFVVGVNRELKILNITPEKYVQMWTTEIKNSKLSEPLKSDVLSKIDYNDYYGRGVLVITVPEQKDISDVNDVFYWREADNTVEAKGKQIAHLTKRFS